MRFRLKKLISLIKAIHTSLAGRWMADKTTDATKVANLYIQLGHGNMDRLFADSSHDGLQSVPWDNVDAVVQSVFSA